LPPAEALVLFKAKFYRHLKLPYLSAPAQPIGSIDSDDFARGVCHEPDGAVVDARGAHFHDDRVLQLVLRPVAEWLAVESSQA
jgi:hypothetical protein